MKRSVLMKKKKPQDFIKHLLNDHFFKPDFEYLLWNECGKSELGFQRICLLETGQEGQEEIVAEYKICLKTYQEISDLIEKYDKRISSNVINAFCIYILDLSLTKPYLDYSQKQHKYYREVKKLFNFLDSCGYTKEFFTALRKGHKIIHTNQNNPQDNFKIKLTTNFPSRGKFETVDPILVNKIIHGLYNLYFEAELIPLLNSREKNNDHELLRSHGNELKRLIQKYTPIDKERDILALVAEVLMRKGIKIGTLKTPKNGFNEFDYRNGLYDLIRGKL